MTENAPANRRLVDSHVHLQDPVFTGQLPALLEQAAQVGISRFVCNGSSEEDWSQVEQLAREHAGIIPCFGLHPWYVGQRTSAWLDVLTQFLDRQVSAVGEIGLDRWIEPRDEAAQEEVFRAQLALARQRDRPVMVHCVRAWGWLMEVLRSESPLPNGFLLHAYGGSAELIHPLIDRGAFFSFAGSILEEHRTRSQAVIRQVPLDRLLIETDAPDLLPPVKHRPFVLRAADGRERNHPANLRSILEGVADLRQLPVERLASQLWDNSRRFLGELLDVQH